MKQVSLLNDRVGKVLLLMCTVGAFFSFFLNMKMLQVQIQPPRLLRSGVFMVS
jgi:hypothetical protein